MAVYIADSSAAENWPKPVEKDKPKLGTIWGTT